MEGTNTPQVVAVRPPVLRPISNHFRDSFLLVCRHWAPLLIVQAVMYFVVAVVVILAILIFLAPVIFGGVKGWGEGEILRLFFSSYFWAGWLLMFIPSFIASVWCTAAMISALGYKQGGMAPIGFVFKKGFQLLPPMLVLALLVTTTIMGGAVLLIFPAVIVALGLFLVWYIRVLEDVSIFEAMGTSWQISKGYKWSIFGRFLLLMLILWIGTAVIAIAGMIPVMGIITNLVALVLNFVVTPYMTAYFYCMYEDLRAARKEVYPMSSGLLITVVAFSIVSLVTMGGVILLAMCLIRRYIIM